MKRLIILSLLSVSLYAQAQPTITPDLSAIRQYTLWGLCNRNATYDGAVYLDSQADEGFAWFKDLNFGNGTIDVDLRGKDVQGESFVGLAFHGVNDSTFEVVYFRPFNFQAAERRTHAVQYVAHPEHPWFKLREEHPEQYESAVQPVPDPNDWFHATIEVDYPQVKVYVNHAKEPSLEVSQLSNRREGWIGLWVGNGSDGYFKNLKVTPR